MTTIEELKHRASTRRFGDSLCARAASELEALQNQVVDLKCLRDSTQIEFNALQKENAELKAVVNHLDENRRLKIEAYQERDSLRTQNAELRNGLTEIICQQPCLDNGSCFYPMHDGEGNYIGEQNVDPIGVIQKMATIAQQALAAQPEST